MQTSDKIAFGALLVSVVSIIVAVTTVMNKSTYDLDSIKSALGDPNVPSGLYAQIDSAKRDSLEAKTLSQGNKSTSNEARQIAQLAEKTAVSAEKDAQAALAKIQGSEILSKNAEALAKVASESAESAKKDSKIALLNSVPIGTILPWIPTDKMKNVPKGWKVCDGTNGTPDLEGRFLMGVRHLNKTQKKGGRNDIPGQGAHSHGGATTSVNSNRITYSHGGDNNGVWFNHSHGIKGEGNHNHGGENRPTYFTVIYIIKTS